MSLRSDFESVSMLWERVYPCPLVGSSSHVKGEMFLLVLVAFNDFTEGYGFRYARDFDLDTFVRFGVGNDNYIATFDTRDTIALFTNILDLDGPMSTLRNRRGRLQSHLSRFSTGVSIRVGLLPGLWNNSTTIRNARFEIAVLYLAFGNFDRVGTVMGIDFTAK